VTGDVLPYPLSKILRHATHTLAAAGCDSPQLDAEVLLAHALDQDRAWLYAHPDYTLSLTQSRAYQSLLDRRARREPVAYLTGHKEFYALDFYVTPHVLIPRPETELLVDRAIQYIETLSTSATIADVGTGSGAIAVTLALHLPQAQIIATDTSPAALVVARRNAARHGVASRVFPIQADLLAPLSQRLDLIVANPPYLNRDELCTASPEVAYWEPRAALDGGPDGLAIIRRLLAMASHRLASGAALLVEIGASQGYGVLELACRHFPGASVEIVQDYANRDRLLFVQYPQ
jgi:release factor glutamine methyltransferase